MFNRPSAIFFAVVALAGVATAVPTALEARDGGGVNQCNTGGMQCCTSTHTSTSTFISQLFGYLSIPVPSSGDIGLSCSPITAGGIGSGSSCTQQPVCCTGNTFSGVIGIGCSPITINF